MLAKVVDTYVELNDEEKRRYAALMAEHKEVAEMIVTWEEASADTRDPGMRVHG